MGNFIKEFKEFAVKGNMIDMAVGIIIGGAFGKIITSLVNDIIMPPIGWLIGDMNFSELAVTLRDKYVNEAGEEIAAITWNYGNFIQVCLDFLIVALCIFFVIRMINRLKNSSSKLMKKGEAEEAAPEAAPETPAAPTKEEELLAEIRDLLKEQKIMRNNQ
jgi:large conductance mechanosensitive channel